MENRINRNKYRSFFFPIREYVNNNFIESHYCLVRALQGSPRL